MTPSLLGTWSVPPDNVAWAALLVSAVLLILAVGPEPLRESFGFGPVTSFEVSSSEATQRRRFVLFAAFVAAFLSLGYIAYYLRGGPRIIDATTYFMQGRALAHGKLSWKMVDPTASFRGRFLLAGAGGRLAGIFPPGYPLLLAAGFLVGAPMVIGPALAAALVVLTYLLTIELATFSARSRARADAAPSEWLSVASARASATEPTHAPKPEEIACLAMGFSVLSVALRYHTADTMSHGAAAVGITGAFVASLRGRRLGDVRLFALAGLATGWVASTRIVSSFPIAIVVVALAATATRGAGNDGRPGRRWAPLGAGLAGMVPGALLLLLANRAATGSLLGFTQRAYYEASDGPPGCFRYGFGAGIGCLYEHGDFVRAHLTQGFGLVAALGTTFRRLRMHLLDVSNFEPLALLVLVPASMHLRRRAPGLSGALIASLLVLGQILVYAPFYFDGNYPGGGARHFADILPTEHALSAIAVALLFPRVSFGRRGLGVLALASFGFAVHGVHDHIALAVRDGGRPAYEPDTSHESQITRGLVFFNSDPAFNLAYDPTADPKRGLFAARQRNDDHDRLLYERLGHPPAYAYRTVADGATFNVWVPPPGSTDDTWRFESETEWPPVAQRGGWAEPDWLSGTCASDNRALTLRPTPDTGDASALIELPVPRNGRWLISPRLIRRGGKGKGSLTLILPDNPHAEAQPKVAWTWNDGDAHDACTEVTAREATLSTTDGARLLLEASGGRVSLDRVNLRRVKEPVKKQLVDALSGSMLAIMLGFRSTTAAVRRRI